MHKATDFQDRKTETHFHRYKDKVYYGVIIRTKSPDIAIQVADEIKGVVSKSGARHINDVVYFSGPFSESSLSKITGYMDSKKGIIEKRIIKGFYETFVGNPAYWLNGYSNKYFKNVDFLRNIA